MYKVLKIRNLYLLYYFKPIFVIFIKTNILLF